MQYSCLIYGEAGKDKNFLTALSGLSKFKHHTSRWFFSLDNAFGGSPEDILKKCKKVIFTKDYSLILCFIDLDKLKSDYPDKWEKEKKKLERKYSDFVIIWQIENAEDEYMKVLGSQSCSKHRLNKLAIRKIKKFINSPFWKKILKIIRERENELQKSCSQ